MDSTSSGEASSSSTGSPTLCEQWAEQVYESEYACHRIYIYPETYCLYTLQILGCPDEALDLVTCQVAEGVCNDAACTTEYDALLACTYAVYELHCYEIGWLMPEGTIEALCGTLAAQALSCDEAGYEISGFSEYADSEDALDLMVDHCLSGANVTSAAPDPETSCGAGYEDLLACLTALDCVELDSELDGSDDACEEEKRVVECKCELGIG